MSISTDTATTNTMTTSLPSIVVTAGCPGIDKLEGMKNYDNWKFQMRMALIDYGLWKCIKGEETDPERDLRALAKISFAVKPICISHIRTAKTSKEAWTNLEKAYKCDGLTRQLTLKENCIGPNMKIFLLWTHTSVRFGHLFISWQILINKLLTMK